MLSILCKTAACLPELHPACVYVSSEQWEPMTPGRSGEPAAEHTIALSDSSKYICGFRLSMGINGERGKKNVHLCYPLKPQPINFRSFVNSYITGTKALWRHLGQLKSALSHIIIPSTLQLFLFYYERTNGNSKLLTSLSFDCLPAQQWVQVNTEARLFAHEERVSSLECNAPASLSHSMWCMNMNDVI